MRGTTRFAAAVLALALGGCATVPVRDAFDDAAALAGERTGQDLAWPEVSADPADVDARIDALLAAPLDAAGAAQVALLADPRLRARYAELARAAAAKVQAGLPPNPFLEVVARFRDGSGGTPQLEVSVVEEVLGLFLLPARKRAAAVELERARLDVVRAAVATAAATRDDFLRYQAERQLLELDRHVLEAVEAAWEMAVQLRAAGNISELDLLVERDFYEQVRMEVSRREQGAADLRERLSARMGLWGERAAAWEAAPRMPDLPSAANELVDGLEGEAVDRSLDLADAVLAVEAAARRAGITDVTAIFPELEIGGEGEREVESEPEGATATEWWYGPSIGLRIPLFDQGGPRRVIASMEVSARRDALVATAVEVRAAARRAATRVLYAERHARYARDVLVPLRTELTAQTQLHYNGMFVGVFQLLDAKRRELEAARTYVELLREYWLARSAVDRLRAGGLRAGGEGGADGGEALGPLWVEGEGAEEGH